MIIQSNLTPSIYHRELGYDEDGSSRVNLNQHARIALNKIFIIDSLSAIRFLFSGLGYDSTKLFEDLFDCKTINNGVNLRCIFIFWDGSNDLQKLYEQSRLDHFHSRIIKRYDNLDFLIGGFS